MIDTARVEQTITRIQLHGDLTPGELNVIQQLQDDYLAMRGIVEDMLHAPPIYFDHDDEHVLCTMCHTSVAGDAFPHDDHKPMCPYGRALALIGPAGGEGEGTS